MCMWQFFSLIIQGGNSFHGPFVGSYPKADVRVRVWRMCDFSPAGFTSANEHNVSVSGNVSFKGFIHITEDSRSMRFKFVTA